MAEQKILLILDNIRSRENVGSIFRTADAAGVSKIYLCGITPTPPHEKISKTALGAETYVPWEYFRQTSRCLSELKAKSEKLKIVALEQTRESQNIFKFKPKYPIALILGNEVKGLPPSILKKCDKKLFIPMFGKKESLNVAVAAGIALYAFRF